MIDSSRSGAARTVHSLADAPPRRAAAPPAPRPPGRLVRALIPWVYLLPALALLVAFTYIPVGSMVGYSFTDWDGLSPDPAFVGAGNYVQLFTRPELFGVFVVSLYYVAAAAVQISLALYFAFVLSFRTRLRNLFKGILFFPYLINGVAVSFVFLYFFRPHGTLDSLLSLFGAHPDKLWLGDPDLVNVSLSGVSVWRFTGLTFVLFLGAIQAIPGELYEAAELDGAGRWQIFRHIVAPGIRPIISLSVILAISGSLSVFEIPFVMTGGAGESKTFVIQTVKLAFQFNKFGLASAAAVVLLLIVLLITWLQRRLVPDERTDLT